MFFVVLFTVFAVAWWSRSNSGQPVVVARASVGVPPAQETPLVTAIEGLLAAGVIDRCARAAEANQAAVIRNELKPWASLCRRLRRGEGQFPRLLANSKTEAEQARLFSALARLRHLDAILVLMRMPPFCGWRPSIDGFASLQRLRRCPWGEGRDDVPWPKEAYYSGFSRRTRGLMPASPPQYQRVDVAMIVAAETLEPRRRWQCTIDEAFRRRCRDAMVTLVTAFRMDCPETGCLVTVNGSLTVACWELARRTERQHTTYVIECSLAHFRNGENEVAVEMKAATPKQSFVYGSWRYIAVLPGAVAQWPRLAAAQRFANEALGDGASH